MPDAAASVGRESGNQSLAILFSRIFHFRDISRPFAAFPFSETAPLMAASS